MTLSVRLTLGVFFCLVAAAVADGLADNAAEKVRRIPQLGIDVPEAEKAELESRLTKLRAAIDELGKRKDARTRELLPDVQIYAKAVSDALKYQEFFSKNEPAKAKDLLAEGQARAESLLSGEAPWTTATGLIVRGYISKIDGSVQPYGLVVPRSYAAEGAQRHRLDLWFHGRGEVLSEVNFLDERRKQPGQFTPPDTFVLHPYGRYCNANKFAGEVDSLEAMASVQSRYRIDEDRICVRGFSMGGAACWQFAVHYSDRWCAANPGAGFAETADFLKVFQNEPVSPPDYERTLWHLYDCTDYAVNLRHCPTVAYSGELDKQKQAADIMADALRREGIELQHIIGPGTKHSYHEQSKRAVESLLANIVARGRERVPQKVSFTTFTLKYNQQAWVTVDALGEHWERARIDAELKPGNLVSAITKNITALTFSMPAGWAPFDVAAPIELLIDGQEIAAPAALSDRSWNCSLVRKNNKWAIAKVDSPENDKEAGPTVKRHDLQGPIDDAFMDSFVFVRPSGSSKQPAVDRWVKAESERAIEHWRRQFRGEARVKADTAVSDDDIASANLVLWGDPDSNAILKKIADRLPIRWTEKEIIAGEKKFPADRHALVLVCPNPLNPRKYVVLNSGFTYRDYDYLNNARQVPKLPDWAVIDLTTSPGSRAPGKIAAADFFSEAWQLKK